MLCDAVRNKQQCYLVSWLEHVLCVQDKTCKFFLPFWRHHLLFNKVGQNSCSLILEKNHCKFSVICVRCMYKYLALCYFPPFLILRRLSFLKTFIVSNVNNNHISNCYSCPSFLFGQMYWHILWYFSERIN